MKYYAGIDLGGTNIAAGVVDENFNIVELNSRPTLPERGFSAVVADMADAVLAAIEKAGLTSSDVNSIGIGAPGSFNPVTKRVEFANNLGWRNVPVIDEIKKHIDKPIYFANDADCAALGEYLAGDAKNLESMLMLTLGTGVGGGLIINGQIFAGGDKTGFEAGHITLVLDGVPCTCGRNGCFESYASITGLIRETIEVMAQHPNTLMREICGNDFRKVTGRTAFEAAKQGDEAGKAVVDRYIYYVAHGLSSLVTGFRPHTVLIGGGISNEGEYLLEPVRRIVDKTIYASGILNSPRILKASLGNLAGIIGAACLETQESI